MNKFIAILSPIILASTSHAAILIPTNAASWDQGSGAANGTGDGGLFQSTTLENGLTKGDPNDPSTWSSQEQFWPGDFQGQDVDSLLGLGSNPWIVYDLGSVQTALDTMFVITAVESGRGMKDVEIFYSSDLTSNPVTTWAGSNALTNGAANVVGYDFSAGTAWTQYGGTHTIATFDAGFGTQTFFPGLTLDMSGISSAQYIGIRALNTHLGSGSNPFGTATGSNSRAGINQIAFTVVPEPSAALLGAIGSLLLLRRRR